MRSGIILPGRNRDLCSKVLKISLWLFGIWNWVTMGILQGKLTSLTSYIERLEIPMRIYTLMWDQLPLLPPPWDTWNKTSIFLTTNSYLSHLETLSMEHHCVSSLIIKIWVSIKVSYLCSATMMAFESRWSSLSCFSLCQKLHRSVCVICWCLLSYFPQELVGFWRLGTLLHDFCLSLAALSIVIRVPRLCFSALEPPLLSNFSSQSCQGGAAIPRNWLFGMNVGLSPGIFAFWWRILEGSKICKLLPKTDYRDGITGLCRFIPCSHTNWPMCFIDILSIVHSGRKKYHNLTAFLVSWKRICHFEFASLPNDSCLLPRQALLSSETGIEGK